MLTGQVFLRVGCSGKGKVGVERRVVGAAESGGLLSPAITAGDLLFVSGQTAGEVSGFEAQAREVLEKLGAILRSASIDFSAVVRCGVYLADIRYRSAMNAIYAEYFPEPRPARTTIECKLAEPSVLVEIDCVAVLK